jgi:ParB family chromosome partitioning protein
MDLNKLLEKRAKTTPVTQNLRPQEESVVHNTVKLLRLKSINEDPKQPRQDISEEGIIALARSIDAKGLLQPIVVKPDGNNFLIIAGHRRYRAYLFLEKESIPAIVINQPLSEKELTELALVENLQREDLNVLEIAQSLYKLKHETNSTQDDLSQITGYSQANISKYLRLFDVIKDTPELQEKVKQLGLREAYESLGKNKKSSEKKSKKQSKFKPFKVTLKKGSRSEIQTILNELENYRCYLEELLNKSR